MNIREYLKNSDTLFLSLFIITPMILLGNMSEFLIKSGTTQVVIHIFLGAFGALIGFTTHYFLNGKSVKIKILSYIALILILIGIVKLTTYVTEEEFKSCNICGYESVDITKQSCNICGNDTWEREETTHFYKSKKEWIRESQLFWFALHTKNENPNFYTPKIEDGYLKDQNWKPSITLIDLRKEYSKE